MAVTSLKSPLTGGDTELLFALPMHRVLELYKDQYSIDVSPYLGEQGSIECHCCLDTGYEFFNPPSLAGPAEFYSELYGASSNVEWAYQKEKWEYRASDRFIKTRHKVLDIGCGGGDFLAYLGEACEKTGLEPNAFGQALAKEKGLTIFPHTIEEHAATHPDAYDVITGLQVLEHIPTPKSFLAAAVKALRPGGVLVVAVPNNDAFLGDEHELPLNMPPHHMGRWKTRSLEALAPLFDLELVAIEYEPLQEQITGWYQSTIEKRYFLRNRLSRLLWYRLSFANAFSDYIRNARHTIHGHTILAAYRKPG